MKVYSRLKEYLTAKPVRIDLLIGASLFIAMLASRIPLRSRILYNWDAVNFALAMENFDLSLSQPHPPGYIVYIGLARLAGLLTPDANTALVALSIFCSTLAVTGLYFLTKMIFDRMTGLTAALLLFFSPLGWLYGEVGLSYAVALPLVMLATALLYQMFFYRRYAIAAAVVIGLAAGVRQDVLFYLGPAWLIGSLRVGRRAMLLSWAAMAASLFVWLLPLIKLTGGVSAYRMLSRRQFSNTVINSSVIKLASAGMVENLSRIWRAALWLFGANSLFLLFLPGLLLLPGRLVRDRRVLFLLALLTIPFLFFLLILIGQPGFLLVYGIFLLMLLARTLVLIAADSGRLLQKLSGHEGNLPAGAIVLTAILVVTSFINANLFIEAPRINFAIPLLDNPIESFYDPQGDSVANVFGQYSYLGLRDHDRETQEVINTIESVSPDDTGFITAFPYDDLGENWRILMYYLPDYWSSIIFTGEGANRSHSSQYHRYEHGYATTGSEVVIPGNIEHMLLIGIDPDSVSAPVTAVESASSSDIYLVNLPAGEPLRVGDYSFSRAIQR